MLPPHGRSRPGSGVELFSPVVAPSHDAGLIATVERFLEGKTWSGIGPLRAFYTKAIDPRATGERLEAFDEFDRVTLEGTSARCAIVPEARSDASQVRIES